MAQTTPSRSGEESRALPTHPNQVAAVQFIFDTVMASLAQNPDRKFVIMEQSFFSRWWHQQSPDMHAQVRRHVQRGQLHVWNGGWVQHDEAAAHYVAMIDQTTRGHRYASRSKRPVTETPWCRFLKDALGMVPRVGFQADPFGHSSTHASLMVGMGGMDAFLFGRADYQVRTSAPAHDTLHTLRTGHGHSQANP